LHIDTRTKILHYISERDSTPQNWLYQELDVSKGRISQLLSSMEGETDEEGLLSREKKGRQKFLTLTQKGQQHLLKEYRDTLNNESPRESTPKQSSYSDPLPGEEERSLPSEIDFHKTVIRCPIKNLEFLKEKFGDKWGDFWGRGWLERKGIKYQENKYNNAVNYYEGGYEIWFTDNYAFIRLGDYRAEADDIYRRCQTVMANAAEAVDFLEENTPVQVDREGSEPCFQVNEQHIALVEEALAQLVVDHPDTNYNQFQIFIEGELRLWIDNSDGEPHLESRGVGKGADDLHFIFNELYRSFIDDKDGWREIIQLAESNEEVGKLPEKVADVDNKVDKALSSVTKLSDGINEMAQVVEQKSGTGSGQIQQQVQEMKSTQQQLEEKIASNTQVQESNNTILSSLSQQLQEIEEAIREEGQSYSDPVQEIFMEVREDARFHDPFFHAQGGHLMAFKSDGSGCETFMKKREIDTLRGNA